MRQINGEPLAGNLDLTPEQYVGIVRTASDHARSVAGQLEGAEARGALRVAEEIERWCDRTLAETSSAG
jgi:hypothetical protein